MEINLALRVKTQEEELIFTDADLHALTLEDLINFEEKSSFTLKIREATLYKSGSAPSKKRDFKFDVAASHTNKCYALTESGWLPPMLALSNSTILADRNIITDIYSRFENGEVKERKEQKPDYFDFTAKQDYRATISLAPFALEGNLKKRPSREEVKTQLYEADIKVTQALPNLSKIPISEPLVDGIMGILAEGNLLYKQRLKFLMSSIHLLGNTAGKMRRGDTWKSIVNYADKAELLRTDICVIAAISSVTASGYCNPCKGILKPKPDYSEEDAYNALCDLQLLTIFIHVLHDFPHQKAILLTKDISLAKFWLGITPLKATRTSPVVDCKFQLHKRLFPLDQYWIDELSRILKG